MARSGRPARCRRPDGGSPCTPSTTSSAGSDSSAPLLADGDLEVRTPDHRRAARARLHAPTPPAPTPPSARAAEAFETWRDVPAPRRGELVRLLGEELRAREGGARRARHARGRQDRPGGPRRGAGDDRHLRPRRRPLAPALRPHDRLRAPRPPHARDLAPARPGRRHHAPSTSRSRSGAGTPRSRSSAATRWSGSRRERTPLTALACQALFRRAARAPSATRPTACSRS